MRCYLEKRPGIVVTSDVLLVLRHDGRNCGPDVAVIEGEFDPGEIECAIHLGEVGGRLVFALEAVSTSEPEIEDKDLTKNMVRYAAEGVEEYFTVYPKPGRKVSDLVGRRLGPAGEYVEIAPDVQGRVMSEKLGLFFSIDAETEQLVVADAETGQRLRILEEEEAARVEAERRLAEEAAARREAEVEKKKEAEARREAEAEKKKEAEARRQAEERAEQALRRHVEDLCGLLGIEWTAERSTAVAGMSSAQLEALRADLLSRKRWP
jgi:flagellar biosynthesis GTPase FlhF